MQISILVFVSQETNGRHLLLRVILRNRLKRDLGDLPAHQNRESIISGQENTDKPWKVVVYYKNFHLWWARELEGMCGHVKYPGTWEVPESRKDKVRELWLGTSNALEKQK